MFIWNAKKDRRRLQKFLSFFFKVLLLEFSVFGCIIKLTRKKIFPMGTKKDRRTRLTPVFFVG